LLAAAELLGAVRDECYERDEPAFFRFAEEENAVETLRRDA
jgi:hypothetical protein